MKPRIKWRHQYDLESELLEGENSTIYCKDESLTQQSFAKDADINEITRRFGLTEVPLTALDPALFRDTTHDPELRDVLDARRIARDNFMALPPKLRKRFHNSPDELWSFVNDPENADEAVRLGILKPLEDRSSAIPEAIPKEPKAAPPETPPQKETPSQKVSPST